MILQSSWEGMGSTFSDMLWLVFLLLVAKIEKSAKADTFVPDCPLLASPTKNGFEALLLAATKGVLNCSPLALTVNQTDRRTNQTDVVF